MPYDWAVQQLRLSLFAGEPITVTEDLWRKVTGQEEAENRNAVAGGKQYSGKWMGGVFAIGHAANRADFVLNYDDTTADPNQEAFLPSIGKWDDLSKSFATAMTSVLSDAVWPINRIAFGAILLLPAGTRDESYRLLDELLVSVDVDPKSREVSFRINWPRMSKAVQGLEINRITSWGSVHFARTVLQLAGGNSATVLPVGGEYQLVRLELDHNTAQGRKDPFEKGQRVPIFAELLAMARENAETGECK